jgi:hypothetical protein
MLRHRFKKQRCIADLLNGKITGQKVRRRLVFTGFANALMYCAISNAKSASRQQLRREGRFSYQADAAKRFGEHPTARVNAVLKALED